MGRAAFSLAFLGQVLGVLCLGFHAGSSIIPACWVPLREVTSHCSPRRPCVPGSWGFHTRLRWVTHSPAGEGSLRLHLLPPISWWLSPGALRGGFWGYI